MVAVVDAAMAVVVVQDVNVLNNPAPFGDKFEFEITFECTAELQHDIEWKIIYVGSAETEEKDQELESIMVGPVPVGTAKFVFEAPAPKWQDLPASEIRGVTVVLITCSYNEHEFVRIGYYVNTDYESQMHRDDPPENDSTDEMVTKLQRHILDTKPRVTRYTIRWDAVQSIDDSEFQTANSEMAVDEGDLMETEDVMDASGESENSNEAAQMEAEDGLHQGGMMIGAH